MKKILFFLLFSATIFGQKAKLTLKSGHGSTVEFQKLSANNKYMISVDGDKVAVLWEVSSGSQIGKFKSVTAADFDKDSKLIYLVNDKGETSVYDLLGAFVKKMPQPEDAISYGYNVVYYFNAIDNILLRGPRNQNISTGKTSYTSKETIGYNRSFSAAINKVASVYNDFITIYDATTGAETQKIKIDLNDDGKVAVNFTQDGKLILVTDTQTTKIAEVSTGRIIRTYTGISTIFGGVISEDGKQFAVLSEKQLTLIEVVSGKKIWEINHGLKMIAYGKGPHVSFSTDGNKLLFGGGNSRIMLTANALNGKIEQRFEGASGSGINEIYIDSLNNKLMAKTDNAFGITWDLSNGLMQKSISFDNEFVKSFVPANQDQIFLYGGNESTLREINALGNRKIVYPLLKNGQEPDDIKVSKDGKYIVPTYFATSGQCQSGFWVHETKTGKLIWQKTCEEYHTVAISLSSDRLAVSQGDGSGCKIHFYDLVTGKYLDEINATVLPYAATDLQYSPRDKYLYTQNNSYIELFELATKKSIPIGKVLPDGGNVSTVKFSFDEKYLYIATYKGNVFYYNIAAQSFEPQPINPTGGTIRGINYVKNGKYLFVSATDNTITVWDSGLKKLVATLYSNSATGDWAVITPDGRFDATQSFQQNIYYQKGLETIPLRYVYEKYYTPKLLPRILAGEAFDPIPEIDIKPKPKTKIQYAEKKRNLEVADDFPSFNNTTGIAEITVNATAADDKIDEIRLFHNGKVVNLATRGLFVTDAEGFESKKYSINLLPGQNTFRAIALNSQRTESEEDLITVSYQASGQSNTPVVNVNGVPIDAVDKNATMHLIVVGINKYQNEKMSLNYALADAMAFKDEIEKDAKSVLANVKTYFVTDNTADKKGITNAFAEVQKTAKAQDVFVFYYAGHGVISDKNKEFYLVPTDVADLKNVDAVLVEKGISSKLLQGYAVDIQAQKQIFILDACQSAGAFEQLLTADANQQKSLAVVSRSTGTHWMAASGSKQFANEFATLGHGAFTYVLLNALKGQAAANKMITVNGLKNFMQTQVPELMKKYGGSAQYPASYGLGNDFPVEVLK